LLTSAVAGDQQITNRKSPDAGAQGGWLGGGGHSDVCDAMRTCEAGGRRDVSTAEASDR